MRARGGLVDEETQLTINSLGFVTNGINPQVIALINIPEVAKPCKKQGLACQPLGIGVIIVQGNGDLSRTGVMKKYPYRDLALVLVIVITPVFTWFNYEQIPYFAMILLASSLLNFYRNWLFEYAQHRSELRHKQAAYALRFAQESFSSIFVSNRCRRTMCVIDDAVRAIL